MKKLPPKLKQELALHDLVINLTVRHDYKHGKYTARQLVAELRKIRANKGRGNGRHFGDPCVHCGVAWDKVPVGDCEANQ